MGVLDDLTTPAGRWFKFQNKGDQITGEIVGIREQQAREFGTGKPEFWDDGNPKLEVLFMIATQAREDEDDDGVRTVRVKGWGVQRNALRDACQKAGRPPIVGDSMRARYVGEDNSRQGGFPAKVYEYTIKLQPEAPLDNVPMDHGIVPPYVEAAVKASIWPDDDTPF